MKKTKELRSKEELKQVFTTTAICNGQDYAGRIYWGFRTQAGEYVCVKSSKNDSKYQHGKKYLVVVEPNLKVVKDKNITLLDE